MRACPSCGASSILGVSTKECAWCGKTVCQKCVPNWHGSLSVKASIEVERPSFIPARYELVGFCSKDCFYEFWQKVHDYPVDYEIGTDVANFGDNWIEIWNDAILDTFEKNPQTDKQTVGRIKHAIKIHSKRSPAFPWWDSSRAHTWMARKSARKAKIALAQNLEKCGRCLDAAKIFEDLRMYEKAKELREKEKHILVKKTDISVNLNALLQQIKDGGIVAVYRCPHCGGNLKIDKSTSLEKLAECRYCGEKISTMEIADFLNAILS